MNEKCKLLQRHTNDIAATSSNYQNDIMDTIFFNFSSKRKIINKLVKESYFLCEREMEIVVAT